MRSESWRVYVADALMAIAENTARFGGGRHPQSRWTEIVDRRAVPEDDRTAEEIIADIAERAGITIKQ